MEHGEAVIVRTEVKPFHSRGILRGLNARAAAMDWRLHVSPPQTKFHSSTWFIKARAIVVDEPGWHSLPPDVQRGPVTILGVNVDLTPHGWPSVKIDHASVGEQAAQHFLQNGLRSLGGIIFGPHAWALERVEGFHRAAVAAGAAWSEYGFRVDAAGRASASGERLEIDLVAEWLRHLPTPVGILAGCDDWGENVAMRCRLLNLRVPEQVAILGVNDDDLTCELSVPPLSSVAIPWRRLGMEVGDLLVRLLAGERLDPTARVVPPAGVMARRSSDMYAIDDPEVQAALRYIRNNAHRQFSVGDILREVATYRRKLERSFREKLGRTVLQEIRRAHIERAKRLLATTELSIGEIADASGFRNATHLGVVFRGETGVTPSQYRSGASRIARATHAA